MPGAFSSDAGYSCDAGRFKDMLSGLYQCCAYYGEQNTFCPMF